MSASDLRLRTFGAFVLERERAGAPPEVVYRAGKLLALLLHLSAHRGTALSRAGLADLLWGDEAPERSRASLRQAVSSLTRLLGPGALEVTRGTVALRPEAVPTDREAFLEALATGDAAGALARYRGSFLAEEPRVAEGFDAWAAAERRRLRGEFLRVAETAGEAALAAGDVAGAMSVVRLVRTAEVEEPLWARLAFDAHALQGATGPARQAIEEWRAVQGDREATLPAPLASRLERATREAARAAAKGAGTLDAAALHGLGASFVGRSALLHRLTELAEQARRGTPQRLLLLGPMGAGKTRLLDEFEARLRLRGTRVVRIRLLPAMRDVPFTALAACLRALVALPGAAGVGEESATALVDFLPELRSQFPLADGAVADADRQRRRDEAFRDLVAAVGEDRFVAILIDDAQHLDTASRQAFEQLAALRTGRHLLLLSARPPVALTDEGLERLEVPPMSTPEVRALLATGGTWPEAPWVDPFLRALEARTGGLPQRVLDTVRLLEAGGTLRAGVSGWSTPDASALMAQVDRLGDVGEILGRLGSTEQLVLRILRTWGRPMPETMLLGGLAALEGETGDGVTGDGVTILRTLEALGLVVAGWNTWAIAHDSIGEQVDGTLPDAERRRLLGAVVRALLVAESPSALVLEHVALLAGQCEASELLLRVVGEVTRREAWRHQRLDARRFAKTMAEAAGRPEWASVLYRRMGWLSRQSRLALGWYSAAAAIVAVGVATLLFLSWPRLVVDVEPLGEDIGVKSGDGRNSVLLYVQPRVSVRNGFGRLLRRVDGSVRAHLALGTLYGDTIVTLDQGMAQFRELAFTYPPVGKVPAGAEVPMVRFSGPGMVLRSPPTPLRGVHVGATSQIRLRRARVNGQDVLGPGPAAVPAGDSLDLEITFEYTTTAATANYVVAAAPSWMPAAEGTIRLAGLPRPVAGAWLTLRAMLPPAPTGHGHLIILMGAEDSADHLMSATNWTVGPPVYGDGNDFAELSEAQANDLRTNGVLWVNNYLSKSYTGQLAQVKFGEQRLDPGQKDNLVPRYIRHHVNGTTLEFTFTPPPRLAAR